MEISLFVLKEKIIARVEGGIRAWVAGKTAQLKGRNCSGGEGNRSGKGEIRSGSERNRSGEGEIRSGSKGNCSVKGKYAQVARRNCSVKRECTPQ